MIYFDSFILIGLGLGLSYFNSLMGKTNYSSIAMHTGYLICFSVVNYSSDPSLSVAKPANAGKLYFVFWAFFAEKVLLYL